MDGPPLVSVCVQTYQHGAYIEKCLSSILMQRVTFPLEIIVGEDDSLDGTREICLNFAEQYPNKVRLFLRSRKDVLHIMGAPSGRYNLVENLKACRGKYIALCEGDDYWTDPMKLQKQVAVLENDDCVSMCGHRVMILSEDEFFEDSFTKGQYDLGHIIRMGRVGHTVSYMFRNVFASEWGKGALKFMMDPRHLSGDRILQLLLGTQGRIVIMDDPMAVYRKHAGGIKSTQNFRRHHNLSLYLLLRHFDDFSDRQYSAYTKPARRDWLEITLTKDVRLINKIRACGYAFSENIFYACYFLLRLPYYFLKALFFRLKAVGNPQ